MDTDKSCNGRDHKYHHIPGIPFANSSILQMVLHYNIYSYILHVTYVKSFISHVDPINDSFVHYRIRIKKYIYSELV